MLSFTRYFCFLRAQKFTCGYWPCVIFDALRIVKNHVIATLPVNSVRILFTRFLIAFYTSLIVCALFSVLPILHPDGARRYLRRVVWCWALLFVFWLYNEVFPYVDLFCIMKRHLEFLYTVACLLSIIITKCLDMEVWSRFSCEQHNVFIHYKRPSHPSSV